MGTVGAAPSSEDGGDPKSSLVVLSSKTETQESKCGDDEDDADDIAMLENAANDGGVAEMDLLGNDMMTDILCAGAGDANPATATKGTSAKRAVPGGCEPEARPKKVPKGNGKPKAAGADGGASEAPPAVLRRVTSKGPDKAMLTNEATAILLARLPRPMQSL